MNSIENAIREHKIWDIFIFSTKLTFFFQTARNVCIFIFIILII